MRLWLLICSDLAVQIGHSRAFGPEHYDVQRNTLTFTTKYSARQTLPVTAEIAELIRQFDLHNPVSFVRQLHQRFPVRGRKLSAQPATINYQFYLNNQFKKLRTALGLERRVIPHDLRRTTAVAMYKHTATSARSKHYLGTAPRAHQETIPRTQGATHSVTVAIQVHSRTKLALHTGTAPPRDRTSRTDKALDLCKSEWQAAFDLAKEKGSHQIQGPAHGGSSLQARHAQNGQLANDPRRNCMHRARHSTGGLRRS